MKIKMRGLLGYNSEITVGVFVGYDVPKSLGKFETGSRLQHLFLEILCSKSFTQKNPNLLIFLIQLSLLILIYSLANQVIKILSLNPLNITLTLIKI